MVWYFIGVYIINSAHYMGTWRKEIFSCSKCNILHYTSVASICVKQTVTPCQSWGDSFITHSNTMLHLQKRAARTIMDAPWDAPSTALLSELNILPFQERVAKLMAKTAFKAFNALLPNYIALKLLRFSAVHARKQETAKEI